MCFHHYRSIFNQPSVFHADAAHRKNTWILEYHSVQFLLNKSKGSLRINLPALKTNPSLRVALLLFRLWQQILIFVAVFEMTSPFRGWKYKNTYIHNVPTSMIFLIYNMFFQYAQMTPPMKMVGLLWSTVRTSSPNRHGWTRDLRSIQILFFDKHSSLNTSCYWNPD